MDNTANTTDYSLATVNGGFVIANNSSVDSPGTARVTVSDGAVPSALSLQSDEVLFNGLARDYDLKVRADASTTLFFADAGLKRVGLGTAFPQELLHIQTNTPNTDAFALFDANGAGSDAAFRLRQSGVVPTTWEFRNQQDSGRLNVGLAGGNTPFKIDNAANNNLLRLGRNGRADEVHITGKLVVNNNQMNVPDYVFDADYALWPLAEVQAFIDEYSHLPHVPSEAEIKANGVDMTAMQMTLLKKVEELTLYTLEQDRIIMEQARNDDMRAAEMSTLRTELSALSALLARAAPHIAAPK